MTDKNDTYPALLLKAGELFLKGENRPAFIKILVSNIKEMMQEDFPRASLRSKVGKFLISGYGHDAGLVSLLTKVFGINMIDEVFVCSSGMDEVRDAALKIMKPFGAAGSFKVDTKRTWKKFPLTSVDINRDVGDLIVRTLGLKVNLGRPEITLKIQIDSKHSYLSVNTHRGAGGLPVGSSGSGLLLLSGGIDSPAAGWLAMRRGLHLECIHFHSPTYTGTGAMNKVEELAAVLKQHDHKIILHTADFTKAQETIKESVREDYRVVLYRWAMLKISGALAAGRDLDVLVTGESLGQVASQTIQNMACLQQASSLPLIRPLVTYDKADTVNLAKTIGTYDISIRKAQDCCSLFVPKHPTTRASVEECLKYDRMLEAGGIYQECMEKIKTRSP